MWHGHNQPLVEEIAPRLRGVINDVASSSARQCRENAVVPGTYYYYGGEQTHVHTYRLCRPPLLPPLFSSIRSSSSPSSPVGLLLPRGLPLLLTSHGDPLRTQTRRGEGEEEEEKGEEATQCREKEKDFFLKKNSLHPLLSIRCKRITRRFPKIPSWQEFFRSGQRTCYPISTPNPLAVW